MLQKSLLKKDLCSDLFLVVDGNGKIVWANHKTFEFFSLDKHEIVGKYLVNFNFLAPIAIELRRHCDKNGEYSHSSSYIAEIRDRGATIINYSFQSILFDNNRITLISLADESDFYSNLETTINAQKLYALGTLMKGFAHDFNNVFTGIISHLDLALSSHNAQSFSQDVISYLSSAEAMAKRGATVVNKLQSLVGSQSPFPAPFDLGDFMKEIVVVMRHCLGRKIKVADFEKPQQMCLVSADQNRIFQVFVNLCLNARDAMPAGGTISFSLEEFELKEQQKTPSKMGKFWKVTVADTGVGIPQEIIGKLFTPFFSTKHGRESIGLGLFVSQKIVESLGGWIEVDSKINEGSKISFYLPALVNPTQGVLSKKVMHFNPVEKFGGGQTILIVDDEEGIRQILTRTLKQVGYKVLQASSCTEVKQLLNTPEKDQIHLVLLDINLEDGSGMSLVHDVKTKTKSKIIVISGEYSEKYPEIAENNFIDAYLNKPFYPLDALQIVYSCLNK